MREAGDADIPALLLAVATVVALTLFLSHHFKARATRKLKILKLQRLAAAEAARVEAEEYSSALASNNAFSSHTTITHRIVSKTENSNNATVKRSASSLGVCTTCSNPATSRCSRCKGVKYCSTKCQIQDWREGHKLVCREVGASVENHEKKSHPVENSETSRYIATNSLKNNAKSTEEVLLPNSYKVSAAVAKYESISKHVKILFPYEHFLKLFNWDKLQLPPCGLINCGNSCFANVVLQCLTYTRPLAAYLLHGSHVKECRRNTWCFMCELQYHVMRVKESRNPFSPIRILSQIRSIGNHLGYGKQEDAHEFMRFAIDSMQSICLDEAGGEKEVDLRSQETTFIHYVFGGRLQSQVKCMDCNHESDRYDSMMDLTVEIQGNVESLEDALAQFTAPEWLDGENKYRCDKCNAYVKARKQLTVHEAPNILTIAFKRFQGGKFGKLNKQVTFREVLDMMPFMSGKGDKPPHYQLYAVIVHLDMLNASFFGHYICFVKDLHGTWYKIDDSKVREVELEKVMQQRAYMLLYKRSVPRPAPMLDGGTGKASSALKVSHHCESGNPLSNGDHAAVPAVQKPLILSNGSSNSDCLDTRNISSSRISRLSDDPKGSYTFSEVKDTHLDDLSSTSTEASVSMDYQRRTDAARFQEYCSTLSRDEVKSMRMSFRSPVSHLIECDPVVRVITEHTPTRLKWIDLQKEWPSSSHSANVDEVLQRELHPCPPPMSLAEQLPAWPTSHNRSSSCPAVLTMLEPPQKEVFHSKTRKIKPFLLSQVAIFSRIGL